MIPFVLALCVHAAPDITVCQTDDALTVRRGAAVIYTAKREGMSLGDGPVEVSRKDLDGDGSKELVIADFNGMSNGMGVRYWNLTVIDPRTAAAAAMAVEDYGDGSLRRERDGRTSILATSWDWQGAHLYFVARPYRYEHGKLVAEKSRGMWQRPYLFSFERERGRGCANDRDGAAGCPAQWLRRASKVAWRDRPPEE